MQHDMNTTHFDKILVVDDATANLQLLTNVLTEQGYTVYPASDGELALEFVRSILPDLILLDIRLPGMNGYEVCRRLKAEERTRAIPVIFISILEDEREKVKGFQAGAVDYITKPFQPEEVLARVRIHLRLRELTEHLERTVAERTAALHAANEQLQIELAERQQAEAALRDSEERFRFVLNNSLDAAYRRNLQTDHYDYMSPVIEHVLGWSVEDMNRMDIQTVLALVHPEDVPMIAQEIDRTNALCQAAGRATGMLEYRMRNKHGEYRWMGDTITVLADAEGRPLYRLGIVCDITERKRAEEEIRRLNQELEQRVIERTAQLEAANKELETFAYTVSHNLRAPLRHLDGFLELLQQRTAAALDEQSKHYMDTIADAARRMGLLIDDLLSFLRMRRSDMVTRPVALASLVREVIQELTPETAGRNIHWQIADLPVVTGDRAMLRMALMNLIANAVKFTRSRARAEIEIGCQPGQETEVVIFVRDNGVGFDMQYVDKLFGVFQRLHRAEDFEGTGIGLANVRRIIQRHGGRTWAEGQIDQGATFYFALPQELQGTSRSDGMGQSFRSE